MPIISLSQWQNFLRYSFPSLHAAISAAIYETIAVNIKKKWIVVLAVVMPVMIGMSRPFLGVHYPTDVLAGWILGLVTKMLFDVAGKKLGYKKAFLVIPVLGMCVFLIINTVMKYPVRNLSLADTNFFLFMYRMFRYMIAAAVTVGVYPLMFRVCKNRF